MGRLVLVPLYVSLTPGLTAPLVLESRCDRTIEIEAWSEEPGFVLEQSTLVLAPGESGVLWISHPLAPAPPGPIPNLWEDPDGPFPLILEAADAAPVRVGLYRRPVDDVPSIGSWEMDRPDGELLRVIRAPSLPSPAPQTPTRIERSDIEGCGIGGEPSPDVQGPRPIVRGTPGALALATGDETRLVSTVRKYTGQLQYCYEKALKVDPALQGRLDLTWSWVDGLASGTPVVSGGTLAHAELSDCVANKIRRWEAPPDTNGETSWTFLFEQRPPIVRR